MKRNKKGFTLIELLAVIVIMGILMLIAIPLMTRFIENSRRDTFIATARSYVNAARYQFLGGDMTCSAAGPGTHRIPFSEILLDAGGSSSFGSALIDEARSFVEITTTAEGTSTYRVFMADGNTPPNFISEGSGNATPVIESELERSNVTRSTALPAGAGPGTNICERITN